MKYFDIRPFGASQEVLISDGINYFKSSISAFLKYEPSYDLDPTLLQLEYQPDVIYQITKTSGVVTYVKPPTYPLADTFISKVSTYLSLQAADIQAQKQAQHLANLSANTPTTLAAAQQQMTTQIYQYASHLAESLASNYSSLERDRWYSTLFPQATAYSNSHNLADCPDLVQQALISTGNPSTDTTTASFAAIVLSNVNALLAQEASLTANLNKIIGNRAYFLSQVAYFTANQGETPQAAIARLLALDYKTNWTA